MLLLLRCSVLLHAASAPARMQGGGTANNTSYIHSPHTLPLLRAPPSLSLQAVQVLKALGAQADVERVEACGTVRAGMGKGRSRRFVSRRGPLLITANSDGEKVTKAFGNLPGVDISNVDRLNLLQLAPGGHVGRFVIWTEAAFVRLEALYGTATTKAADKKGYSLPRASMAIADLARVINSSEIQKAVRPAVKDRQFARQKKNPLRNKKVMDKLNPYAATLRKAEAAAQEAAKMSKGKVAAAKRGLSTRFSKTRRAASKAFIRALGESDECVRPADVAK